MTWPDAVFASFLTATMFGVIYWLLWLDYRD